MSNYYYKEEMKNIIGANAVEELYELLEKHNIPETKLWYGIFDCQERLYNKEDCRQWLENNGYSSLSENEKAVEFLSDISYHKWDCEYGTWDNIENGFKYIKYYMEDNDDIIHLFKIAKQEE